MSTDPRITGFGRSGHAGVVKVTPVSLLGYVDVECGKVGKWEGRVDLSVTLWSVCGHICMSLMGITNH